MLNDLHDALRSLRRQPALAAVAVPMLALGLGASAAVFAVLDPGSLKPAARIAAAPGLGAIRFAPGGRLGFAVHPAGKKVHILDAASNRIVQTADVEAEPDQVTFSDELAYAATAAARRC